MVCVGGWHVVGWRACTQLQGAGLALAQHGSMGEGARSRRQLSAHARLRGPLITRLPPPAAPPTRADDAAALPDAGQAAQVDVPPLLQALGADDVVALCVAAHLRGAGGQGGRGRSRRDGLYLEMQSRQRCVGMVRRRAEGQRAARTLPSPVPTCPGLPCWRRARPARRQ